MVVGGGIFERDIGFEEGQDSEGYFPRRGFVRDS